MVYKRVREFLFPHLMYSRFYYGLLSCCHHVSPCVLFDASEAFGWSLTQIVKNPELTSISYRSDRNLSDRSLIDVDPMAFAIWEELFSYNCPSSIMLTIKNMDKLNIYSTPTKHRVNFSLIMWYSKLKVKFSKHLCQGEWDMTIMKP